jgi:hypothetical protein
MIPSRPKLPEPMRHRLMDDVMDAYLAWHEACASVEAAYQGWTCAREPAATCAFWGYRAALDREERASDVYAELIGQARRLGGGS